MIVIRQLFKCLFVSAELKVCVVSLQYLVVYAGKCRYSKHSVIYCYLAEYNHGKNVSISSLRARQSPKNVSISSLRTTRMGK